MSSRPPIEQSPEADWGSLRAIRCIDEDGQVVWLLFIVFPLHEPRGGSSGDGCDAAERLTQTSSFFLLN